MNKPNRSRFALGVVIAALSVASAYANEELDVYTSIYRMATTPAERYAVLRNVADAKVSGAGALYAEALTDLLVTYPTIKSNSDRETADANARLLVTLLGESKYQAAAGDIWKVADTFQNPLVAADALVALGSMRSEEYFPFVLRTLEGLNLKPTSDPESGEKIAYGAVLALEKYGKIEGYAAAFYASVGWYSKRIKEQAERSLPIIAEDPSAPLTAIIRSAGYGTKLTALQKELGSKASPEEKTAVAVAALEEGQKAKTVDVKENILLASIRKLAISALVEFGSSDPAAVPLLDKAYKGGYDDEEVLLAVRALAANRSDPAVRALASYLMALNVRRKDGFAGDRDDKLVRAVIAALGATKSPLGRPALQQVGYTDWTNAVKNLAAEALKALQ